MRNRSKISLNIYIIRHGKTPLNERRCFIGKNIDEGLSEGGKAKLRPLTELSNCDYVFSGKMKRCAETADILFGNRKITIIDGFMEYDFGDFEGKNHEELDGNKDYQKWLDSNGKSGIPNAETLVIYTGLPVRREFVSAATMPVPGGTNLLVTGGALGAQILDDVVPAAIAAMKNKKIFVTHQTRPENVEKLQKFYASHKIRANVLSFIHDMAGANAGADLVIGRSGASTVVELQTIGRPAILVPLGINPDQAANAASFAKGGGGFAIEQSKFTVRWLTATLTELFDNPSRLAKMATRARVENNAVNLICDAVTK